MDKTEIDFTNYELVRAWNIARNRRLLAPLTEEMNKLFPSKDPTPKRK